MDLGANADGELLQRALDGERVTDPGILELVAVLHAVQAVDQARLAPRAEFVSDLRARLLADDPRAIVPVVPLDPADGDTLSPTSTELEGPLESTSAQATQRATGPEHNGSGGTVSVLRVAARPLKFLAAAAAAVLVIGGALGFASRSAVPGDALYGVKQLLDRAAVQLSGSRYEQGLTYLAQAQEHIGEARNLIDRGQPSTHDLDTAYDSASDATRRAQTILLDIYRSEGRADALSELSDFYTRAIPQVDAMRPRVPADSLPSWQRLRDLLGAGQVATLREIASCSACGDRAEQAKQLLSSIITVRPTSGTTLPRPSSPAPRPSASLPRTQPPSATLPSGGLPSATLPSLPRGGVDVTGEVTLPGGTINLPGAGVNSTSVGVGGGGVTLPGATVSLPHVGVSSTTVRVGGGGGVTLPLPGATIPLPPVVITPPALPRLPTTTLPKLPLPPRLP
ncbi:DUF5667 domain-containing protein [Terrabacter terrigena]|uniref:DUF5667 domain-containing protein n=1 Tax=Terrabacter terrigena TaxID=574718 RepID=A0ABW3MSY4_9MICO